MDVRRSLHLFDLDDTLITTTAKVRVCDDQGQALRFLTPAEFTDYRLASGESFDFREFSDVGILSRGILVRYTRDIIEQLLIRGTRSCFGILTARGDKSLHAGFLIRLFRDLFGIRLQKGLIFAVSDARFNRHKDRIAIQGKAVFSSLSVPERKALVVLEDLISRGFNDISFYDDSRENLAAFRHLAKEYPKVVFKAHFIDPTWSQRLAEFVKSNAETKTMTSGKKSVLLIWEHHGNGLLSGEKVLAQLEKGEKVFLPNWPIYLAFVENRFLLFRHQA
jgi:hypothetical protein